MSENLEWRRRHRKASSGREIWARQTSMLEDSTERRFSWQKNGEDFVYRSADGSVKLAARDQVSPKTSPLERNTLARGEEHNDVFQGELDASLNHSDHTDDAEARDDFWSMFW